MEESRRGSILPYSESDAPNLFGTKGGTISDSRRSINIGSLRKGRNSYKKSSTLDWQTIGHQLDRSTPDSSLTHTEIQRSEYPKSIGLEHNQCIGEVSERTDSYHTKQFESNSKSPSDTGEPGVGSQRGLFNNPIINDN